MPRQRINYSRDTYVFPDDFPQRLVGFKEVSGLPWAEIARLVGTSPLTVRRWWKQGVRPNTQHLMALLDLAEDKGLVHLLTERRDRCGQAEPVTCNPSKRRACRYQTAVRGGKRSKGRIH